MDINQGNIAPAGNGPGFFYAQTERTITERMLANFNQAERSEA